MSMIEFDVYATIQVVVLGVPVPKSRKEDVDREIAEVLATEKIRNALGTDEQIFTAHIAVKGFDYDVAQYVDWKESEVSDED